MSIRTEILTLDEGEFIVQYPDYMSEASFADVQEHMVLLFRRMHRRVLKAAAVAGKGSPSDPAPSREDSPHGSE